MNKPIALWGITGHYPGWFPKLEMYLVSAAALWSAERGKFIRRRYPDAPRRMFLDSGGFSFFARNGDYPFTRQQYVDLVDHYQPLLWASLDYPCEPSVHRSHKSNRDRIKATLNHLEWFTQQHRWGLMPVVQGYTPTERVACLTEMARRQLATPYMAIGSLCIIRNVQQIHANVSALTAAARDLLPFPVHWHLLGVKLDYIRRHHNEASGVWSFDTAAWGIGLQGETRNTNNQTERQRRFWRYHAKVRAVVVVETAAP
jgi:hypothetical protein